ncbi:MAG: hypothetical protein AB1467_02120 [Candidatus Diapherotrites archaeon]
MNKKGKIERIEEFPKTINIEKLKLEYQVSPLKKRKLLGRIKLFRRKPK